MIPAAWIDVTHSHGYWLVLVCDEHGQAVTITAEKLYADAIACARLVGSPARLDIHTPLEDT